MPRRATNYKNLASKAGLIHSPANWMEDKILCRSLDPLEGGVVPVHSLAQPVSIIIGTRGSIIAFDYSYFILLRSFCRSLFQGGDVNGAIISLYHFEIGRLLDKNGFYFHASGLLQGACELRTRFSVYQASIIHEAFLYQLSVNISIAHEQAHRMFEDDQEAKRLWVQEAADFLKNFSKNLENMFPDTADIESFRSSIEIFFTNDLLLEEVACDICAIDHAITNAILDEDTERQSAYVDNYYAAARLMVISLYTTKIFADAAALVVSEIIDGKEEAVFRMTDIDQSFLSQLQVRFQVMLLKVVSMKVRLGLVSDKTGFQKLNDVINTNNIVFSQLISHVMNEVQEARRNNTIFGCLSVGHALSQLSRGRPPDNRGLIAAYLTEFWFCRTDM